MKHFYLKLKIKSFWIFDFWRMNYKQSSKKVNSRFNSGIIPLIREISGSAFSCSSPFLLIFSFEITLRNRRNKIWKNFASLFYSFSFFCPPFVSLFLCFFLSFSFSLLLFYFISLLNRPKLLGQIWVGDWLSFSLEDLGWWWWHSWVRGAYVLKRAWLIAGLLSSPELHKKNVEAPISLDEAVDRNLSSGCDGLVVVNGSWELSACCVADRRGETAWWRGQCRWELLFLMALGETAVGFDRWGGDFERRFGERVECEFCTSDTWCCSKIRQRCCELISGGWGAVDFGVCAGTSVAHWQCSGGDSIDWSWVKSML